MNLNDLSFTLLQGGSGRIADGSDFISGLLFYNNIRPAAFTAALTPSGTFSNGGVIQLFSASDALALGINNLYTDETQATGTVQITAVGNNGDTIEISFQEWKGGAAGGNIVSLGIYEKVVGDTTATNVAAGVALAINALTNVHGYTATSSTDTVTITVRKGLGIFPNTGTPFIKTITGSITATVVQNVVAGIASLLAVYYYHIQRYFAKKADGTVYVGIFDTAGAVSFSDIDIMFQYSDNTIVQLGIWDSTKVYSLSSLTVIQTRILALQSQSKYLSNVIYSADIKAISGGINTLGGGSYNLATLNNFRVSAIIDNDGNGVGYDLFKQLGITISALGAALGCESQAAISEDYGNCIDTYDCNDGNEFDTLMFGDGTMYSSVSTSLLNALNTNRYVFLSKVMGSTGSWFSDDHTACPTSNDYAYAHDGRTIDRVIKNSIIVLTPLLKAKGKLKTDGTMTQPTIDNIISTEFAAISPLIASSDLAGDVNSVDPSQWVLVNPAQKPKVTGKLIVSVKLAENGIFHSVSVPIGYGTF